MVKIETALCVCSLLCSAFSWWGAAVSSICVTVSPLLSFHCSKGIGPQRLVGFKYLEVNDCCYHFFLLIKLLPMWQGKRHWAKSVDHLIDQLYLRCGSHQPSVLTKMHRCWACGHFCQEIFLMSVTLFVSLCQIFFLYLATFHIDLRYYIVATNKR